MISPPPSSKRVPKSARTSRRGSGGEVVQLGSNFNPVHLRSIHSSIHSSIHEAIGTSEVLRQVFNRNDILNEQEAESYSSVVECNHSFPHFDKRIETLDSSFRTYDLGERIVETGIHQRDWERMKGITLFIASSSSSHDTTKRIID